MRDGWKDDCFRLAFGLFPACFCSFQNCSEVCSSNSWCEVDDGGRGCGFNDGARASTSFWDHISEGSLTSAPPPIRTVRCALPGWSPCSLDCVLVRLRSDVVINSHPQAASPRTRRPIPPTRSWRGAKRRRTVPCRTAQPRSASRRWGRSAGTATDPCSYYNLDPGSSSFRIPSPILLLEHRLFGAMLLTTSC